MVKFGHVPKEIADLWRKEIVMMQNSVMRP